MTDSPKTQKRPENASRTRVTAYIFRNAYLGRQNRQNELLVRLTGITRRALYAEINYRLAQDAWTPQSASRTRVQAYLFRNAYCGRQNPQNELIIRLPGTTRRALYA